MKKIAQTTLCLALLSTQTMAMAETELYKGLFVSGVIDAGYARTTHTGKNADATKSGAVSSILGVSNLGLRGEKDFGEGLTGFFNFQVGFLPTTGKLSDPDTIFSRNAYVGLRHEQLGSLSFGRQWVFNDDWLVGSVFKGGYNAGSVFKFSEFDAISDIYGNSVKYVSPVFGRAFQAGAMYADKLDDSAANDASSLSNIGAKYADGPVFLAATVLREKGSTGGSYQLTTLGGSYRFDPVKLRLGFAVNDIEPGAYRSIGTYASDSKAHVSSIGIDYSVTDKLVLSYDNLIRKNTTSDQRATVNRLLAVYDWRPEVSFLVNLAWIDNSGNSTQTLVGDTPVTGGHSQRSIATGVRVKF